MAIENSRLQNLINKIQGKQPNKGEKVEKEQANASNVNIFTGQQMQAGNTNASIFGTQGVQGGQNAKGPQGTQQVPSKNSIFDMFRQGRNANNNNSIFAQAMQYDANIGFDTVEFGNSTRSLENTSFFDNEEQGMYNPDAATGAMPKGNFFAQALGMTQPQMGSEKGFQRTGDPNKDAQAYATANNISLDEAKEILRRQFGEPEKPEEKQNGVKGESTSKESVQKESAEVSESSSNSKPANSSSASGSVSKQGEAALNSLSGEKKTQRKEDNSGMSGAKAAQVGAMDRSDEANDASAAADDATTDASKYQSETIDIQNESADLIKDGDKDSKKTDENARGTRHSVFKQTKIDQGGKAPEGKENDSAPAKESIQGGGAQSVSDVEINSENSAADLGAQAVQNAKGGEETEGKKEGTQDDEQKDSTEVAESFQKGAEEIAKTQQAAQEDKAESAQKEKHEKEADIAYKEKENAAKTEAVMGDMNAAKQQAADNKATFYEGVAQKAEQSVCNANKTIDNLNKEANELHWSSNNIIWSFNDNTR